jgi:hypothetical protein
MKAAAVSTPDELLDASLESMGYLELSLETREQLIGYSKTTGNLDWSDQAATETRVGEMLALIGATTEYQFG